MPISSAYLHTVTFIRLREVSRLEYEAIRETRQERRGDFLNSSVFVTARTSLSF